MPNSRFKKARAISHAIMNATDDATKEGLTAKLAGLLGEAAFIDKSYKAWAERTYAALASLRLIGQQASALSDYATPYRLPH